MSCRVIATSFSWYLKDFTKKLSEKKEITSEKFQIITEDEKFELFVHLYIKSELKIEDQIVYVNITSEDNFPRNTQFNFYFLKDETNHLITSIWSIEKSRPCQVKYSEIVEAVKLIFEVKFNHDISYIPRMMDCSINFDIKLVVNGRIFYVHKKILSERSDYFLNLFENKTEFRLELNGIEDNIFEAILGFVYHGYVDSDKAFDMFEANQQLLINKLDQACVTELILNLKRSNMIKVLEFSYKYNLSQLKKETLKFFSREGFDIDNFPGIDEQNPEISLKVLKKMMKKFE